MPRTTTSSKDRLPPIKTVRASYKSPRKAPQQASHLNERYDVLKFLADVYQDHLKGHSPGIPLETRIRAAIAFLPYRYPRLAAYPVSSGNNGHKSHEDWVQEMLEAKKESERQNGASKIAYGA